MSRIGLTGPQSLVCDRGLRAARAIYASTRHTPTAAEILLARHMHRDGCDYLQIHAALGWNCVPAVTRQRFRRLGLNLYRTPVRTKPHFGAEPYLSRSSAGTDFQTFRPKQRGAA